MSPLGVGGMASVYLAVQESLDREVALKVLAPALAANQEFATRFLKEGRITARLSHPHLVTVFDIGQRGAIYYLAAEYLPGGTLRDKLERGISIAESLQVACDIARGLHVAHDAGFVHRDIKPGNVMFRANGSAVLVDFGIAKAMDGKTMVTQAGSLIGTPRYMSPEQIGAQALDGRSDLYSLGVMLFELLTGKPPYEANDAFAVALMHVSHPLPQLPATIAWLQPLIDGLMAKDATARFATGEAFVAAVEQLLAGTPEGLAVQNAPGIRKRAPPRLSLADQPQPVAPTRVLSEAVPAASRAGNESRPSNWQARRRGILIVAIITALVVLGGATVWTFFLSRNRVESARTDPACGAALALVATAISQADLTQAQTKFAALPGQCSAHKEASQIRDDLIAAAGLADSARNQAYALLDRGDLPGARDALLALERTDRFAKDLPELRNRLDQAQNKGAGDATVNRTAEAVPQVRVEKDLPPNTGERRTSASSSLPRPQSDGSAAVRQPAANPSVQKSQKCMDISLRAGLGEETAEERQYISENCR